MRSLLNTPEYLEGSSFSPTVLEEQKLKVVGSKIKENSALLHN